MLRAETGMSLNPAHGINSLETFKYHLRQQQKRLYHDYDWPILYGYHDILCQAGQRYYDFPVDPESLEKTEIKWSASWEPLPFGISGDHYTARDSDEDIRSDPVECWQFYLNPAGADSTADNIQFEVWPLPATDDVSTVRFWGKRALPALTSNDDKAILDDLLIVLYAAAKILKGPDREAKLAEARAHYATMKRRSSRMDSFVLGGEPSNVGKRPGPVRIALTGGS